MNDFPEMDAIVTDGPFCGPHDLPKKMHRLSTNTELYITQIVLILAVG